MPGSEATPLDTHTCIIANAIALDEMNGRHTHTHTHTDMELHVACSVCVMNILLFFLPSWVEKGWVTVPVSVRISLPAVQCVHHRCEH